MKHSGILLHISSLPSPYGIGTLGREAHEFIDFLAKSEQKYWQILPICPTGYGDSPYQSFSSFAGNPYFIDLDMLVDDNLLYDFEFDAVKWSDDETRVDYGRLNEYRFVILRKAADRLLKTEDAGFNEFCEKNNFWLDGYSTFMSLKAAHDNRSWLEWENSFRNAKSYEVEEFANSHSREIDEWKAIQYLFFKQWDALKAHANEAGISIIGDLPIYVSLDSADVWSNPEMFQLDRANMPIDVSGCPPDGFSETGQLWGNPVFDWEYIKNDGYSWWIRRIEYLSEIYHVLRIDHFRGFDEYYAIPFGSEDAKNGVWKQGPGMDLFRAVKEKLGDINIIAEDLGFLTPSVKQLLVDSGFPGMKVLEMAFDQRDPVGSDYLPDNFIEHCVAYVGTHDNDTAFGWLATAPKEDVDYAIKYLGLSDPDNYNWEMMEALWKSCANLTIVQAQDVLGLGSESRMNTPSVPAGNWQWRAEKGAFTEEIAARLATEMKASNRQAN